MSDDVVTARPERPIRADARRNHERLVTAARAAFIEHGSDASLEDIARRAGVGIGTLYRRFPNRQALLEAVYIEEIESMCGSAKELAALPPWDGLVSWLRSFIDFGLSKQAIASELVDALGRESDFFQGCKATIYETATLMFARAREAGVIRGDVDPVDVLRLVGGISHTNNGDAAQAHRMLDLVLDGLRAR